MQIHVAKNGQQTGPFEEAQVREKLAAGEFAPTDLAWHADLAGWQPLSTLFPEAAAPAPAPSPVAATPVFPPAPTPFAEPPLASALPPAPTPFSMPPPAGGGYAPLPVAGLPGQLTPPQFYNPGAVGDPNLATAGSRLVAIIIDVAIVYAIYIPAFILGAFRPQEDGSMSAMGVIGSLVSGLLLLAIAGYQIYKVTTTGQTIGKKIMGVRILMLDGRPAGFVQGFLMRSVVAALPGICFIYSIVDACFIFRQDRRCIHDMIAGTKVVRA